MYWYYKFFLVAIVGLILYGISSIIGIKVPPLFTEKVKEGNVPNNTNQAIPSPENLTTRPVNESTAAKPSRNSTYLYKKLTPRQNATYLEARQLFEKDQNLDEAYEKLMTLLEDKSVPQFSKGWYEVADFITKINSQLLISSAPSTRKENHKVVSGDYLSRIARRKTSVAALQKGNDIPLDSQNIRPGQVLRYFPGKWNIEIVKSQFILMLFHKGRFFKYYKVGTGKENRTPEGQFVTDGKDEDPIWTKNGVKIPSKDPRNVLGTRWIGIKPSGDTAVTGSGYGIHGTKDPESIGTPASQGCIRMINSDVEDLYDIIPHTKVVITIRK